MLSELRHSSYTSNYLRLITFVVSVIRNCITYGQQIAPSIPTFCLKAAFVFLYWAVNLDLPQGPIWFIFIFCGFVHNSEKEKNDVNHTHISAALSQKKLAKRLLDLLLAKNLQIPQATNQVKTKVS